MVFSPPCTGFTLTLGDQVEPPKPGSVVVVRPESVHFSAAADASVPNSFEVKILDQEYLGEDIQFRVASVSGTEFFATRKATAADRGDRVGTTCYASIDPNSIYVIR